MPVPEGPQTTRFSCRPIHSSVRSAGWVGAGIDDSRSSQACEGLAGGKRGAGAAGAQRGAVPAGDLLGQQRSEHLGGVPPLRLGGGQHLGGGAAHVRQPHPPQQRLQSRRRSAAVRGRRRSRPPPGGRGEVEVVDGQVDVVDHPGGAAPGGSGSPGGPRPVARRPAGPAWAAPVRAAGSSRPAPGGPWRSPRRSKTALPRCGWRGGSSGRLLLAVARPAAGALRQAVVLAGPAMAGRRPRRPGGPGSRPGRRRRTGPPRRPAQRPVHRGGPVQRGQLDGAGHLGPHPPGPGGGGLGQPRRRAVADRQELLLGRGAGLRDPSARRAEPAGSAHRRPAGCPAWSAGGGPPRPDRRADVGDHHLLAVPAHPYRPARRAGAAPSTGRPRTRPATARRHGRVTPNAAV